MEPLDTHIWGYGSFYLVVLMVLAVLAFFAFLAFLTSLQQYAKDQIVQSLCRMHAQSPVWNHPQLESLKQPSDSIAGDLLMQSGQNANAPAKLLQHAQSVSAEDAARLSVCSKALTEEEACSRAKLEAKHAQEEDCSRAKLEAKHAQDLLDLMRADLSTAQTDCRSAQKATDEARDELELVRARLVKAVEKSGEGAEFESQLQEEAGAAREEARHAEAALEASWAERRESTMCGEEALAKALQDATSAWEETRTLTAQLRTSTAAGDRLIQSNQSLQEENRRLHSAVEQHQRTSSSMLEELDKLHCEARETVGLQDLVRCLRAEIVALQADSAGLLELFEELRLDCTCPIQQELLENPVVAADGYTYERRDIERWFLRHGTSPMTNLPVCSRSLVPNICVAKLANTLRRLRRCPPSNLAQESTPSADAQMYTAHMVPAAGEDGAGPCPAADNSPMPRPRQPRQRYTSPIGPLRELHAGRDVHPLRIVASQLI